MRAEADSHHLVEDRLRAGYRYLRWQELYRPRLGTSQAAPARGAPAGVEIERFTTPLGAPGTDRAVFDRIRARCAEAPGPVVVTLCLGRLPASRSEHVAVLRAVAALAPGPRVVLELVRAPRFAGTRLPVREQQARFEAALERFARAVRAVAGPHAALTVGQDTVDGTRGPLPRFFYRAVDFPLVELRGEPMPAAALTRALLGLMHDRPGLAVCGAEGSAWCALVAGHAAVLRHGSWSAERLRRCLVAAPPTWTDPAQEPAAILMPQARTRAEARRIHAQLEQLVAVLHGRLRLPARIACESDPLAVDKQKLILTACPEMISTQGALLLERQCQRGRVVVAWADHRTGALARHPIEWTRDARRLIALAVRAGVLDQGASLHAGTTLHRVLQFGNGTLAGRFAPTRGSAHWQPQGP